MAAASFACHCLRTGQRDAMDRRALDVPFAHAPGNATWKTNDPNRSMYTHSAVRYQMTSPPAILRRPVVHRFASLRSRLEQLFQGHG